MSNENLLWKQLMEKFSSFDNLLKKEELKKMRSIFVTSKAEFKKLFATYERIESDTQQLMIQQNLMKEFMNDPDPNFDKYTISEKYSYYAVIDYQNCIFQSKILMDNLSYLASIILNISPPFHSFTKLRNAFLKNKNELRDIDSIYSEFIIKNTNWYENFVFTRDKFLAHGRPTYLANPSSSKIGHLKLFYLPYTRRTEHVKKTNELIEKYKNKINLENFDLVRLDDLLSFSNQMTTKDKDQFRELIKERGAELPDIYDIVKGINDFTIFTLNHFMKKIKTSKN